jgi:hypothetical protein
MRRVARFACVVLVLVLVISHVVTIRIPVRAGAGPAGENGDANGDGVLDLSDPIYLLRYLFQEGPAPVACADSPDLLARVAQLEAQVMVLGGDQSAIRDELGALDSKLDVLTEDVALSAAGLRASFEVACQNENGVYKTGPGALSIETPAGFLRDGQIVEGRIAFETNRQADLFVEFEIRESGGGDTCLLLDDQWVTCLSEHRYSVLLGDVPAGSHTLYSLGQLTCGLDGVRNAYAVFSYFAISYMD